jgi:hypothetical protein
VAQGVGPEFKPQYCKEKKRKENALTLPSSYPTCGSPEIGSELIPKLLINSSNPLLLFGLAGAVCDLGHQRALCHFQSQAESPEITVV